MVVSSDAKIGKAVNAEALEVQVLMGTPAALGTIRDTHAELQITGMFLGPETEHVRGDFDYRDFDIDLSLGGPRDFGGVSGGGLWRVWLYWSSSSELDWKMTLRGVAFYQLPIIDEHRVIRCHGGKSIQVTLAQAEPQAT